MSFGLGKLSVMVTITVLARRLGPDGDEAIPVMRLIAVSSLIYSIGTNVGDVYKAVGRPGILWKLGIFNIAVLAVCLVNLHVFRVVPQFSNTSTAKFSGSFSDKVIQKLSIIMNGSLSYTEYKVSIRQHHGLMCTTGISL